MNEAKTPDQIASLFGCTEDQARAQIIATATLCRDNQAKAESSKSGSLRGFSAAWYADRAAAFEAVL